MLTGHVVGNSDKTFLNDFILPSVLKILSTKRPEKTHGLGCPIETIRAKNSVAKIWRKIFQFFCSHIQ